VIGGQTVSNLVPNVYNGVMQNMTCAKYMLAMLLAVAMYSTAGAADDKSGLSVGHEAITSFTDDPKSKAVGALTARYGFNVTRELHPYLGTGLGYSLPGKGTSTETGASLWQSVRTGVAGQAGVNYKLNGSFSLNLDYTYIQLSPEPRQNVKDPAAQKLGVGLDIRF